MDRMGSRAQSCQHGALSGHGGRFPPAIVFWVPTGEHFGEACTLAGLPEEISTRPSVRLCSAAVNGREECTISRLC